MQLFYLLILFAVISVSFGCKCRLFQLDHYFCTSDYMIEANITTDRQTTSEEDFGRSMIWYGFQVLNVYKGNEDIMTVLNNDPKVWTSGSSASCGRYFEKGTTYIISGAFKGRLTTSSCSFGRALDDLTNEDKMFFQNKEFESLQCSDEK